MNRRRNFLMIVMLALSGQALASDFPTPPPEPLPLPLPFSAEACLASGGRWDAEQQMCLSEGSEQPDDCIKNSIGNIR